MDKKLIEIIVKVIRLYILLKFQMMKRENRRGNILRANKWEYPKINLNNDDTHINKAQWITS